MLRALFAFDAPAPVTRRRLLPGLCAWLAAGALFGTLGLSGHLRAQERKEKQADKTPPRRVLVFPPVTKGGQSDYLVDTIVSITKGRLATSGRYSPLLFTPSLPIVKRALLDQTIRQADVQPPYDQASKIRKLTRLAGFDMALVSSIEEYQYNMEKQQVSLVMTAQLIDYAGDKPVIRTVGESDSSPQKSARNEKDYMPAITLARDLTEKIMKELLKPKEKATPAEGEAKPSATEPEKK
jgi:hypothetical protein